MGSINKEEHILQDGACEIMSVDNDNTQDPAALKLHSVCLPRFCRFLKMCF